MQSKSAEAFRLVHATWHHLMIRRRRARARTYAYCRVIIPGAYGARLTVFFFFYKKKYSC